MAFEWDLNGHKVMIDATAKVGGENKGPQPKPFMLASLGLGLLISSATRVQFVAAMISVIAGFLPAFFLSGLLFDLGSTPMLVQIISLIIPARYFVIISQTIFLAGNIWSTILPAAGVLVVMATVLLGVTMKKLVRRLPQ